MLLKNSSQNTENRSQKKPMLSIGFCILTSDF